jgi:hypothetical protein
MNPEFDGKIKDHKWALNRAQVFDAYVAGQDDGNYYLTLHKRKGPPKTLPQMAYYYAVIVPTALKQMIADGNKNYVVKVGDKFAEVPLTKDIVDTVLKSRCAKFDGETVTDKANMSKEEASDFIDRVIRWCARYLHCVIPDPDPNWRQQPEQGE